VMKRIDEATGYVIPPPLLVVYASLCSGRFWRKQQYWDVYIPGYADMPHLHYGITTARSRKNVIPMVREYLAAMKHPDDLDIAVLYIRHAVDFGSEV
jgi:hypothetical protein